MGIRPPSLATEVDVSASLLVSNLSPDVTEKDLRELFSALGACDSVRIIKHHDTGVPRGIAFVEMRSGADARTAITSLAAQELRGRALRVDLLIEQDRRRPAKRAARRTVTRTAAAAKRK